MKIDIDISSYPNKLALLYSGGADSTLLYYLTYKSIIEKFPDKSLELILLDRYNKPVERALSLYEKISKEIGDNITVLRFLPLEESIPNNLKIMEAVKRLDHDAVLWAVNQYPDDTTIRPKSEYTVPFDRFRNHSKLKLPFVDYKKTDIVETFIALGLTHLLEQTHSCGEPLDIPCGQCFNCRERAWAYRQLGLTTHLGI
jgi:7-cyano-7-deazaguanine synthase in queuosine biosynthesis